MKNKKTIGMIGIILALCIVIGIIYSVSKVNNALKEEEKIKEENKNEIKEKYVQLNEMAENFNTQKKEYDDLYNDTFLNNLKEKEERFIEALNSYQKILKEIQQIAEEIHNKCNQDYQDNTITKNCSSIKKTSESASNVFQNDVERYNILIDNYNTWLNENNINDLKLERYHLEQ